ncbi:MAG: hypothetical protein KAI83_00910 [Thiomargarita sp.]|nr:hypothetical protein [Thiomargarita sp.]
MDSKQWASWYPTLTLEVFPDGHDLSRTCYTGALVLGDTVLMGAIPLEDMDLVISPRENTVTVNPNSPNIPSVIVKSLSSK